MVNAPAADGKTLTLVRRGKAGPRGMASVRGGVAVAGGLAGRPALPVVERRDAPPWSPPGGDVDNEPARLCMRDPPGAGSEPPPRRPRSGVLGPVDRCIRAQIRTAVPPPWVVTPLAPPGSAGTRLRGDTLLYRACRAGTPLCVCLVVDVSPDRLVRAYLAPVIGSALTSSTPLLWFGLPPVRVASFSQASARTMLERFVHALEEYQSWALW